jgi:hypothetical protein
MAEGQTEPSAVAPDAGVYFSDNFSFASKVIGHVSSGFAATKGELLRQVENFRQTRALLS